MAESELRGLCTGVGWHDDALKLELRLDEEAKEKALWPLEAGRELAVRLSGERRCIGYRPPGADADLLPCPERATLSGGSQCPECFQRAVILPCLRCDGERCRNPARRPSCVRPKNHALYLCAFGPGAIKVGVARWSRRAHRVAEQGAREALIVARDDGQMIRRYERMVARSGIPDRLQPAERLRALAEPAEPDLLLGELKRRLAALRPRLPIPWLAEPEVLDFQRAPQLDGLPELLSLKPGDTLRGRIAALAGNNLIVDSDRGQRLALDAGQLVGFELEPLGAGEASAGQLALGLVA